MSGPFADPFTRVQQQNTPTVLYTDPGANWTPPSDRSISTISSFQQITGGLLVFTSNSPSPATIVYDFTPYGAQNFSLLKSITFGPSSQQASPNFSTTTITIFANATQIGTTSLSLPTQPDTTTITVNLSNIPPVVNNITMTFTNNDSLQIGVTIGGFTSTLVCVARGSKIKTLYGYKNIEELQRGDEIWGGRVARVITYKLSGEADMEAVIIKKNSLGENLPFEDLIVCAEHYFIHKDKRRLAKSLITHQGIDLVKSKIKNILPPDDKGDYYLYDIQYEHEGEYEVNGLLSQSRSPFAEISPLPKELYFNPEKYKDIRVKNTLTKDPEISFLYLLPDGREVESVILKKGK